MLGTVIAEGFIAVEAEDANEVKQIGKSVLNLAKALGVEKKAQVKRARAITRRRGQEGLGRCAQANSTGALEDVREAMIELNSEPLSQLVSLGGWLRGTEALTAVVGQAATPRTAPSCSTSRSSSITLRSGSPA